MIDGSDLFPASYGGVLFRVEKGERLFGRRIVTHEFPMRDEPFNEDLGASARRFEIIAYIASDAEIADADVLEATLQAMGPQILTLPDSPGDLVRFKNGTRTHERDRLGYVAFKMTFIAEGAAAPVISAPYLGQLVSIAVNSVVNAAGALLGQLQF